MTDDRMALIEALQKADDGNFLRTLAETVLQILMEADVEGLIGAGRYERSGDRSTWRDGFRDRTLDTRLGQLDLRIPKLGTGSYFPPFLEARKTTEKALVAVIQGEPASAMVRAGGRTGSPACRPGRSTTWCRRWGFRASPRARYPSSARVRAFLPPVRRNARTTRG